MFISEAAAADNISSINSSLANFIPLVLICVVVYFFLILPQHRKLKERKRVIDLIKRGDVVITSGGIIGEVNKVDDTNSQFIIEIAPKVEIKVLKSSISEVLTQKTAKADAKAEKKNQTKNNVQQKNNERQ